MRLYDEGVAYHSSLHLAGAAEEMLGKIADYNSDPAKNTTRGGFALRIQISTMQEISTILDNQPASASTICSDILGPRNYVKHYRNRRESKLDFNPKREAREVILNAIENLNAIPFDPGSDIDAFEIRLHNEEIEEAEIFLSAITGK
ncbi:MAG: hypothetical protein ACYC2R_12180 [Burkholderiales bacterium]